MYIYECICNACICNHGQMLTNKKCLGLLAIEKFRGVLVGFAGFFFVLFLFSWDIA